MANAVVFTEDSAQRIADAVRFVESPGNFAQLPYDMTYSPYSNIVQIVSVPSSGGSGGVSGGTSGGSGRNSIYTCREVKLVSGVVQMVGTVDRFIPAIGTTAYVGQQCAAWILDTEPASGATPSRPVWVGVGGSSGTSGGSGSVSGSTPGSVGSGGSTPVSGGSGGSITSGGCVNPYKDLPNHKPALFQALFHNQSDCLVWVDVSGCVTTSGGSIISSGGGGSGTVTSVGLSMPSMFTVTGSPITTAGTFTVSLASGTQNLIFATPNGSSGPPLLRAMVAADMPSATGDVTGPYSALVVAKINGVALGTTTATSGNILIANGTQWVSVSVSGDATITSAGAFTLATILSVQTRYCSTVTTDVKGRITAIADATTQGTVDLGPMTVSLTKGATNSGGSFTLAAGKWHITVRVTGVVGGTGGDTALYVWLYDGTGIVSMSEVTAAYAPPASANIQTGIIDIIVTPTSSTMYTLRATTGGSGTVTVASITSNANGRTCYTAMKIG